MVLDINGIQGIPRQFFWRDKTVFPIQSNRLLTEWG